MSHRRREVADPQRSGAAGEAKEPSQPIETLLALSSAEKGQATVAAGDLAYWEPGNAFCLFWGPTPMSRGNEIRPANPVTVFGKLDGDPKAFDVFRSGTRVKVERAE